MKPQPMAHSFFLIFANILYSCVIVIYSVPIFVVAGFDVFRGKDVAAVGLPGHCLWPRIYSDMESYPCVKVSSLQA